jgi:hypothetical protein
VTWSEGLDRAGEDGATHFHWRYPSPLSLPQRHLRAGGAPRKSFEILRLLAQIPTFAGNDVEDAGRSILKLTVFTYRSGRAAVQTTVASLPPDRWYMDGIVTLEHEFFNADLWSVQGRAQSLKGTIRRRKIFQLKDDWLATLGNLAAVTAIAKAHC